MNRKRIPLERKPLFAAIFCDDSAAALAQRTKAAHWAGADLVCVELKNLPLGDRTPERLRILMDATLDQRGDFPMPQPPLANMKGVFENMRFAMP